MAIDPRPHPDRIGKVVGSKRYVEISYINELGPEAVSAYERLWKENPDFAENAKVVDYDKKTGNVHFSIVPRFDEDVTPKIEKSVTYNATTNSFGSERKSGQVLHRTDTMVGDGYSGFDKEKQGQETEGIFDRIDLYNERNPENTITPNQIGGSRAWGEVLERVNINTPVRKELPAGQKFTTITLSHVLNTQPDDATRNGIVQDLYNALEDEGSLYIGVRADDRELTGVKKGGQFQAKITFENNPDIVFRKDLSTSSVAVYQLKKEAGQELSKNPGGIAKVRLDGRNVPTINGQVIGRPPVDIEQATEKSMETARPVGEANRVKLIDKLIEKGELSTNHADAGAGKGQGLRQIEEYWKKEGITGILVGSDPFHGIGNISEATGYWEDVPEHEKMIDSPSETEPLINPDLYTPREPLIHPETKNPTGPYINVGSKLNLREGYGSSFKPFNILKQGVFSWLPSVPGKRTVAEAALRANRSNNK